MKILTRYVAASFAPPFAFALGLFSLLVLLGHIFDKMQRLATSSAPPHVIAEYVLLQFPYWTVRVIPMATLLAVLFTVTGFVRSGEFVAVQAAGFEARRFFRPLLALAALVGLLAFSAQETVLPACFSRAQRLWRERIHPEWKWDRHSDVVLVPAPDRFLSAELFVVKEGSLRRPVMDDYGGGRLRRQVDAASAAWDGSKGVWVFTHGVVREFGARGALASSRPFSTLDSDLRVPPRSLVPPRKRRDEMSVRDALREIRRLREIGRSPRWASTALHQKLAYPFANLILCALGVPIALRLRRAPRPVAVAAALVVSFLYLWLMEVGWMLGKSGAVPAPAAAWLPHLAFGALAFWLYRRI